MSDASPVRLSPNRSNSLAVGVLATSGAVLVAVHLVHVVADLRAGHNLLVILGGAGLPLLVALGIFAGAFRLAAIEGTTVTRRILPWFLVGGGSALLVAGGALAYEVAEGATLTHPAYVLLDFVTVGAAGGALVGWYDARNAIKRDELGLFREMVRNAGHPILLTDSDGVIRYVNPAFEERTGYRHSEAVGRTPGMLNSGVHEDEFFADLWETISAGKTWQGEVVNERKDGTRYRVDQTITPLVDDGEVQGYVAVNKDITELREREAALERKNRRLDQFASVVSHDLRNPLEVATGHLSLYAETGEREHYRTSQEALERMEHIIDDVLTIAREGSDAVEPVPVDLAAVATAAWQQVETREADIRIDGGEVVADPGRLQQLLENLFRNAIQHGGPAVTVRVEPTATGFAVDDDGAGIPPEDQDQVLETGFTTHQEGTGLGLEIVQQIAADHDWSVAVTASEAGGARIEVTGVTRTDRTVPA